MTGRHVTSLFQDAGPILNFWCYIRKPKKAHHPKLEANENLQGQLCMINNQNSIGKPFTRILYFTPKPDLKKHKKDGHMVCCI